MVKITDRVKGHRINYYLAHPLLAAKKIKTSVTYRKSCSFKQAYLQALTLYAPDVTAF